MLRLSFSILCTAALLALAPIVPSRAGCGPDHMAVVGAVTTLNSGTTFTVQRKHKKGKKASILVRTSSTTRYIRADRSAGTFADVTPNSSVQVSGTRYVDGSIGAEKILITSAGP